VSSVGGRSQHLRSKLLPFWPEWDGLGWLVARAVGPGWFWEVVETLVALPYSSMLVALRLPRPLCGCATAPSSCRLWACHPPHLAGREPFRENGHLGGGERMRRKELSGVLGVELAPGLEESTTPYAGISLLIELMRRCGVDTASNRVLAAKKGLSAGQMVECFVVLSALGGECLEDFALLRQDRGLEALLGYRPPAVETARQYLDRFHDEKMLASRPEQGAFVPMEPSGLAGLGVVIGQVIRNYVGVMTPGKEVTLDVDAHLVQTTKREALVCYEGYQAYQPLVVGWAETGLVLADEFRDGNVPAGHGIKDLVDRAHEALPAGEWRVRVRSDSAAYQWGVLDHWNERGWEFAVSADT
jgi:Transposase DDE domain group 1